MLGIHVGMSNHSKRWNWKRKKKKNRRMKKKKKLKKKLRDQLSRDCYIPCPLGKATEKKLKKCLFKWSTIVTSFSLTNTRTKLKKCIFKWSASCYIVFLNKHNRKILKKCIFNWSTNCYIVSINKENKVIEWQSLSLTVWFKVLKTSLLKFKLLLIVFLRHLNIK
jgi:hypothetical protein